MTELAPGLPLRKTTAEDTEIAEKNQFLAFSPRISAS